MGSLRRLLKQTGTYWALSSRNRYGDQTFATPAEVSCRFEATTELFIDTLSGDQQHSRAIVYSTTEFAAGGYLYLGTSVATNPKTVSGADQIRRVDRTPSVNGREILYKAWL